MGYNSGESNGRYKHGGSKNIFGITSICLGCGKEYTPKQLKPNRPPKYCSIRCSKLRDKNNNWANGGESFTGIHNWGRYNIPKPELCQCCGKEPPRDLANISNEYKKEISDWEWLCRRCHMTKDGRMNNLRHPRTLCDKVCERCKKNFRPHSNNTLFCSRTCYDLNRKNPLRSTRPC